MGVTALVSVDEYLATSFPDGDKEYVDGKIVERNSGEVDHADLQSKILGYLTVHYPDFWSAVEVRVQVKPARFRVPDVCVIEGGMPDSRIVMKPPLLVVEIVSRDDRAEDLQEKIDGYLEFGIPHIWVVNPRSRRGYVHTPEGSCEAKDGTLRTAASSIELPLSKVFPAPTGRQSAD